MRKLPAMKPRTECDCHPVASIISGIVAPRLAFRSVMTAAAFEPGRDRGAGDADFAGVTAFDFVFGVRAMRASPSWARAQCRRSHCPKPPEPRGEPYLCRPFAPVSRQPQQCFPCARSPVECAPWVANLPVRSISQAAPRLRATAWPPTIQDLIKLDVRAESASPTNRTSSINGRDLRHAFIGG